MEKKIRKSAYSKFDDERSVAKSIRPKVKGNLLLKRVLMILLYVAFVGVWLILGAVLQTYVVYLMTFSLLSVCILIFFTWRYVDIEYELTIHEGMLGFALIYGGLKRKELFSCRIRDLEIVAPYQGNGEAEQDPVKAEERQIYVAKIDSPDNYYAVYQKETGEKVLLIFETEEKTLKMLKYYNSAAFRSA